MHWMSVGVLSFAFSNVTESGRAAERAAFTVVPAGGLQRNSRLVKSILTFFLFKCLSHQLFQSSSGTKRERSALLVMINEGFLYRLFWRMNGKARLFSLRWFYKSVTMDFNCSFWNYSVYSLIMIFICYALFLGWFFFFFADSWLLLWGAHVSA